jgi:hypothetical protein
LWVTWFDPSPKAQRIELDEPLATSDWPSCSLGSITAGSARGTLGDKTWDLTWEPLADPLPYLPASFLYDRRFPRSNGAAVVPHATLHGRYGETALDGWHGVVGHNWGREHAERWCWLHAALPDGWIDVVLVRVRLGRVLSPWTAGGGVHVDGALRRTRPGRVRLDVAGDRTSARIPLRGGHLDVKVHGSNWVTWDYASPSGPPRTVRNCSVADARVGLDDGRAWELSGTVAAEHGRPS